MNGAWSDVSQRIAHSNDSLHVAIWLFAHATVVVHVALVCPPHSSLLPARLSSPLVSPPNPLRGWHATSIIPVTTSPEAEWGTGERVGSFMVSLRSSTCSSRCQAPPRVVLLLLLLPRPLCLWSTWFVAGSSSSSTEADIVATISLLAARCRDDGQGEELRHDDICRGHAHMAGRGVPSLWPHEHTSTRCGPYSRESFSLRVHDDERSNRIKRDD